MKIENLINEVINPNKSCGNYDLIIIKLFIKLMINF